MLGLLHTFFRSHVYSCCVRLGSHWRFSCNLINDGLAWHHDFCTNAAGDMTTPGMSLVIHLGDTAQDLVYLDFEHCPTKRYVCRPGTVYTFPGYALAHRTQREFCIALPAKEKSKLPRRYSIGIWFPFKKSESKKMDDLIHETWPLCCDDQYEERYA